MMVVPSSQVETVVLYIHSFGVLFVFSIFHSLFHSFAYGQLKSCCLVSVWDHQILGRRDHQIPAAW